jgi:hypothetical protein
VNGPARPGALAIVAVAAITLGGCSPNQANILLRKQNQQLTDQVSQLQRTNAGLSAQLEAIDSRPGATTQELPQSRLDQLFTTHGLSLGRLTGGFSSDITAPDQMVKVYVVPTDDDGEPIKAAGSFKVELFDLAEQNTRLGTWNFTTEQSRADWYGHAFLYTYALDCPWQTPPRHADLLLRVTFTDDLTGRQFIADKQITVRPPPGP